MCDIKILFSVCQAGRQEPSEALDRAIDNMCKKTKDLRRQVRIECIFRAPDKRWH